MSKRSLSWITADYTLRQAIILWHQERLQKGMLWLENLLVPGASMTVVSVLEPTNPRSTEPLLILSTSDPLVLFRQNVMLHAMSKQRSSLPVLALKTGESIQLLRSLRSGQQLWGQVYEVTIPERDLNGTRLVLKIYEERLYPFPAWNGAGEEAWKRIRRWPDANDCLTREQSAYSWLHLLQGSAIPRSYGFYEVRLPDGTVAPAHLLD
ncbi:hypothetical protein BT69DRAFT_432314 [Atractiella rhizophila]|nr:hypothetical protein BT69DRAFT_432314 [Atractiella rhizophila]